MVSESKRRANERYTAKNYEQISFRVRKGTRNAWKSSAERLGLSLAGLITKAVTEYLQKHRFDYPSTSHAQEDDSQFFD